jgi:hypothetical protein
MSVLRLSIFIVLLLASVAFAWQIMPAKSRLSILRDDLHFPVVSGFNLDRQEFEFPRDFGAESNLLIVPFQQWQQNTVNTWIPYLQDMEDEFPDFMYYELPTIYEMPALSRTFLNEGMRAGIPDQTARERTITLYLDKAKFKAALNIASEEDIYLFLVDRTGEILWQISGAYTPEKAKALFLAIRDSQRVNEQ